MASNPQRGTIRTTIHKHADEFRVSFSSPADGYTLDDLDALRVAIEHARQQILEQQQTTPQNFLPPLDKANAFAEQLSRLAAPS